MSASSKRVVVTGATGTIGQRAVTLLAESGANVAVLVRDPKKAAFASSVKVLTGSFDDAASLKSAFAGADTVVSITPASAHGVEHANAVTDTAKAAGVRRVVRISALKADVDGPTDNTRQHGRTEAHLEASRLTYVILRPHLFLQNLFASAQTIAKDGKIYWGTGSGKMGAIDTRDISDAVAAVVSTDRFDNQTLELTGPESIDYHTIAKVVSEVAKKQVDYVPVTPDQAADAVRQFGVDEWTVGIIRDYCTAYSKGWGDFTTDNVEKITGKKPRSVRDFVSEVLAPALTR